MKGFELEIKNFDVYHELDKENRVYRIKMILHKKEQEDWMYIPASKIKEMYKAILKTEEEGYEPVEKFEKG